MKTSTSGRLIRKLPALAFGAMLLASAASGWGQISISASTNYSQNFNSLGTTGASIPWTNNITLVGWHLFNKTPAAITSYAADAGGGSGGFYSYGSSGATDRALGGVGSGGAYFGSPSGGSVAGWFAVAFVNNTGSTIGSASIGFDGEQWRNGGNTTAQTMVLQYGFGASFASVSTWIAAGSSFNFASPIATSTSGALDGNASANRSAGLGGTISGISWSNGSTLWIRWIENNDTGNDHGLAIDNFSFSVASSSPTITGAATATAFTTTYGASSAAQIFSVSGSNLTADLVATAPTGFEVSSDGATYGSTATFAQSGGLANGSLRIRLKADAAVGGSYNSQNIVLSSTGASSVNITTASSGNSVSAKALTITGLTAENKNWDGTTTVSVTGTPAYSGLVNSESFSVSGSVTWAFADANVGTNKSLTRTGTYDAPSANYTVTQPTLTANIIAVTPSAPSITGITAGDQQLSVAFTAPSSNGGVSITNYEYSINGGGNWTTPSPAVTSSPLVITGLSNGTTYDVQLRAVNSAGSGAATSTTQGTPEAPTTPTITVSTATLSGALSTTYGTASSSRSFTVSGASLSGDLTVAAPSGLEVSLSSGSGYADSLTLTQTSGSVSSTTIHVRLKATAAAGNYNSQSIAVSGGGATTQNVATTSSGTTVAQATLTVSGISIDNKIYDRTTAATIAGTASYSGLQNGETFSVSGTPSASFADRNVGNGKSVTVSGYTEPSANYRITQPTGLTANITAKELSIAGAAASNKVYNGTTAATITGTLSGVIEGDTVTLSGTGTFASANVGTGIAVTSTSTLGGADAGNYSLTQPTGLTADITIATQTITFGALTTRTFGDGAFTLSATASSGLTVSYSSSDTSVATVAGNTVTIVGAGTATITASQAGDSNYSAATSVDQTLTVNKGTQTITGVAAYVRDFIGDTYSVGGTVLSGLPLSYSSSNTAVATVDASTGLVTAVGSGTTTITVSQAGNANYNAALSVTQTVVVSPAAVYYQDFGSTSLTAKPYTGTPPVFAANLSSSSWTTSATTFAGFAGSTGASVSLSNSGGTPSPTYTLTFTIAPGYQMDITGLSYWRVRSPAGAQNIAITINGGSAVYTDTAVPSTTGADTGVQTVTGKTGLTGTVTIVLTMSGASGTGTFRVDDFTLLGSVSAIPPALTINSGTSATATALITTYGTASTAQTFTITGSNLTADITANAPIGFEVSSDGTTYGSTATLTRSGASASGTLRLRLAATAVVGGNYDSQTITLASTGATTRNITTAASGNVVNTKSLTISGLTAENKNWDGTTSVSVTGTPAYSGLANGETFSVNDSVTWAFPDANVGTGKTVVRTGSFSAPSANYTVTQPALTANISAVVASAPTIDSIVGGNGQLSVAFSAPSSDGGASITNYEYSTNGGTSWTVPSPANTASPLIISGLINGTIYDVQLRAVNSAGSGAASSTTQGAPVAPSEPTITLSKASLAAKTTTYGAPSAAEAFTVAGATLNGSGDLTVTAPTGFEVSTDGMTYSSSVNLPISGDAVAETTIYARLAATAAVSGSYNSQNITVSGGGATTQNLATASSGNAVSAKALTITGLSASGKVYDGTTNVSVTGTPEYVGLANGEAFSVSGSVTWAFPNASVGNAKPLTRTGDYETPSSNYALTQPTLSADITQATAPNLTAATNATVDNPFEVTFNETSSLWRSSITSITVGGTTLSTSAYDATISGKIVFNPALSALLQSSGAKNIVIAATGHNNASVTQSIGAGSPMQLSVVTQPTAPATNGAVLATQPVVRLLDLYNNVTTNSDTVTAAATQTNWVLGGTASIAALNGTATFSGLTATSAAAVTNATITFASGSLSAVSSSFNLPAPPAPNDGTSTAISLTVNGPATNGSFAGSTPTFSTSSSLKDVWYKFVATSTNHTLTVNAPSTDPDVRVYEGTGTSFDTPPTAYSTPTPLVIGQLAGVTEETVIATNFVAGRTYFVMVQEDGAVAGDFNIQVRTASASIATWNPAWSGTAASPLSATSKDANLDSGSVARVGLTGQTSSNRYNSSGWNSTGNYLTFTLTAAAGYRLDLNDQILYGNWGISSGSGPAWFEVRSSVDNYASIVGYFDVSTSSHLLGAIRLPSTGYSSLSSVTFRVVGSASPFSGTGSVTSGTTGGFSALRVTGSLIQLPVVTPATVTGTVGTSLSYNISATGTPTSYAISSGTLPSGLSLDTTTGVISGTPSAAGDGAVVSVTASNSAGTSVAANLTFNIAKATPSITSAPTASAITYGQTLADSVLSSGTASVAGSFAFTAPSTAPNAGTASQSVIFTPTDTANYSTATTTVSVTVNQKALSGSFTASKKTFDGTTAATVTGRSLTGVVGSDDVSLDGGTANFDNANAGTGKTVTLAGATLSGVAAGNYALGSISTTTADIDQATPSITVAPTASNLEPGQTLSFSTLTGGSASVAGDFAWTIPSTVVSVTGNYSVTFTPTDAANYNTTTTLVNVTVNQSGYDSWASTNGLTGNDALGSADPDGDGFDNNAEYAFGTNPKAPNGALLTTIATNGVFRTSWNGPASGVTYGVQFSTNLSTMAFSNDPTVTIQTNNGVMSFTNSPIGNKFFRVRATSN